VAANAAKNTLTRNTLNTLTLDTEVRDDGDFLIVNGDNTFTLAAGTYEIDSRFLVLGNGQVVPGYIRLLNITDSSVASSNISLVHSGYYSDSIQLKTTLKIASSKTFKFEYTFGGTASVMTEGGSDGAYEPTITDLFDRNTVLITRKAYS
jgi:hypothetical protein